MQRQPRLSRSEVVARLRALAKQHGGAVSPRLIATHDGQVLRSLPLHFPTFALACRAARVEVAKPPPRSVLRRSPNAGWSRDTVVAEIHRLDAAGASTGWAELMESERGGLVRAAAAHAGGLQEARSGAGVEPPARQPPVPRWDHAAIVREIQARRRSGQTLASSRAPQRFVAAARWHFGSWEAALAAAGIEPGAVRLQRGPYSDAEILDRIRGLARDGIAVRPSTLKAVVKLDTVRKRFGSIAAAVRAAGLEPVATHGNQKWSRERVVDELKARAARGEHGLTRGLARAAQLYFGGAPAARAAAGLPPLLRTAWTAAALVKELRRRARRGDSGHTLWSACKRLFGSVAAARRAAGVPSTQRAQRMADWDRRALLGELRRRLSHGEQLSRGLVGGLRREFGSLTAARALAARRLLRRGPGQGRGGARAGRSTGWQRWSRPQVIERLQAWHAAGGGELAKGLSHACTRHFGSVVRACAAAELAMRAAPWTPGRIRQALREPGVDVVEPALVAACIDHFGSVTAARAAAARPGQRRWSKATVIAELQARTHRGLRGVGPLLRDPAIRLFGSTDAALQAAAQAPAARRAPRAAGRPSAR